MLFNSYIYILIFLPLTVVIYFLCNKYRLTTISKSWLVVCSLFFYGYWNVNYVSIILSSMLINFSIGVSLHKTKTSSQSFELPTFKRKTILVTGLLFNLGALAYFKYVDFFILNINYVLEAPIPSQNIALPLAISFFTFQQIAYLIDCYQYDTQNYDFLSYCLFVSFFPQLIAGPIVHHKEMMPQFKRVRNFPVNWNNIFKGLFVFSLGLFKKVVIADTFSIWANTGFGSAANLSFYDSWIASLSYTFQLYYDFSGYSDMAIGAALLFNIHLPINFNSPYRSVNIQEFWKKWHITLSGWLRVYVYIPLGGNRISLIHSFRNVIFTFLIGGLWHGAGWTFILWGGMHGFGIILHRIWSRIGFQINYIVGWLITFIFINTTWVFFRSDSLPKAIAICKGMVGIHGFTGSTLYKDAYNNLLNWTFFIFDKNNWLQLPVDVNGAMIIIMIVTFLAPCSVQMIQFTHYNGYLRYKNNFITAVTTGVILGIALTQIALSKGSEFLYFNF